MKKILVPLFCACALLGSALPAEAGGVSWGFPLPFPFLFYKFGCGNCNQTNGNGYSKEYAYSKENGGCRPCIERGYSHGYITERNCCKPPWWLQYRLEYDCETSGGQTTAMPGVGGPRDP
jgi:hypothetical protein